MTMVSEWLGPSEGDEHETTVPQQEQEHKQERTGYGTSGETQAKKPSILAPLNPELKKLLERADDRLLRDVGMSRESASAEIAKFWAQWSRQRGPWGL